MICAQCGTENGPGDKFCEQCGSPLGAPVAARPVDGLAATMVETPPEEAFLIRADDQTQRFTLGNRVVVGRLDTCDIPIHDKSVSREHARLSQLPGGFVVEDLGSTNGTLVNGQRITEARVLRPGDVVTFGSIEFSFDQERQAVGAPEVLGSASTQPFQYRPPPVDEPEPVAVPEPSNETADTAPPPAFDFPPLQPFSPVLEPTIGAPPASSLPVHDVPPAAEAPLMPVIGQPEPFEDAPSAIPTPSPSDPMWIPPSTPDHIPDVEHHAEAEIEQIPPVEEEEPAAPIVPEQPADHVEEEQPVPDHVLPAAMPVASTLPSSRDGDPAHEAMQVVSRLSELISSLAGRLAEAEGQHQGVQGRLQDLESAASTRDAVRRALQDVPAQSMTPEQLSRTQDLLDRLIQHPRDVELLLEIGRHAPDIAAVVNEYGQLRRVIERAAAAVNPQ